MNARAVAALAVGLTCMTGDTSAWAHYRAGVLSPAKKRAYHACLYATYIHDYCRFHAWGPGAGAYDECVSANRAGRIRIGFAYWGPGIEGVCRSLVQEPYSYRR